MRRLLIQLCLILGVLGCQNRSDQGLDYHTFDQAPGMGWRALSEHGKFHQAAVLIDEYVKAHADLLDYQTKMLLFHAGQMYAFDDDYQQAIKRLEKSRYEQEPFVYQWNAAVNATIAFLNHDLEKLRQNRTIIAEGPRVDQMYPNTKYVDQLIKDFGKPYRDVDPTPWGGRSLPPRQDPRTVTR